MLEIIREIAIAVIVAFGVSFVVIRFYTNAIKEAYREILKGR